MKPATTESLATIKIIYCAPYTLALYGIPYEMRADVGQAPRHLWEASHERPRNMRADLDVLADWIYLDERDPVVKAWLARVRERDGLPGWPHEWLVLAGPMVAPELPRASAGPTLPAGPGEHVGYDDGSGLGHATDACDYTGDY